MLKTAKTALDKVQFSSVKSGVRQTMKKTRQRLGLRKKNKMSTVKPVLSGHSQKDQKWVFNTNYRLMQVKSIAECSNWISTALSYHMALRTLRFFYSLSGGLRLVSQYMYAKRLDPDEMAHTVCPDLF